MNLKPVAPEAALEHIPAGGDVILPMANKKDVTDIPKEFKEKINFVYVENLDEVFAVALDTKAKKKSFHKKDKKPKLPSAASAA